MTRHDDAALVGPLQDEVSRTDERRRKLLGRSLIFASPLLAAVWSMSLREATAAGLFSINPDWFIVMNGLIAAFASSAGVCLLHGRLLVRLFGSLAYAFLSLLVYGLLIDSYFRFRY